MTAKEIRFLDLSDNDLLRMIYSEIRKLNENIENESHSTCSAERACEILGIENKRLLKDFVDKGVLTRAGSKNHGYKYYRDELLALQKDLRK